MYLALLDLSSSINLSIMRQLLAPKNYQNPTRRTGLTKIGLPAR